MGFESPSYGSAHKERLVLVQKLELSLTRIGDNPKLFIGKD